MDRLSKEQYKNPKLCVAAIDIGTGFSSFAFSLQKSQFDVCFPKWGAGTMRLISHKTSTSILLTPEGTFSKFGFEAENKYADLLHDKEHTGWIFFARYKMLLHQSKVRNAHLFS